MLVGGTPTHQERSIRKSLLVLLAAPVMLAQAEPVSPLDELTQLRALRVRMKDHFSENNPDTRFVVDRNDLGLFKTMRNVGLVHANEPNGNVKMMGSATLLNGCYALTAYHVVESRDIIVSSKKPETGMRVKFSVGRVQGRTDHFSLKSLDATVVDPGILDLKNRRWSDDIALLRLDQRLVPNTYERITLGHVFEKNLTQDSMVDETAFVMASGYAYDKIVKTHRYELYADFCTPKAPVPGFGITTNCVITGGMSGGAVWNFRRNASGTGFEVNLVGLPTQPSVGNGLFTKNSNGRSQFAPLTPAIIAKIEAIIDRPTNDRCEPL